MSRQAAVHQMRDDRRRDKASTERRAREKAAADPESLGAQNSINYGYNSRQRRRESFFGSGPSFLLFQFIRQQTQRAHISTLA